jgi:hypothetical protein
MYTEFSPYNYCNNSPMMFRDPSGMSSEMMTFVGMDEDMNWEVRWEMVYQHVFSLASPLVPGIDKVIGIYLKTRRGGGNGNNNGIYSMSSYKSTYDMPNSYNLNADEGAAVRTENTPAYTSAANALRDLNKTSSNVYQQIQISGSSFSLVYPTFLSNRLENSIAKIKSTLLGTILLSGIDFYLKHFKITARVTINSYLTITAICTNCTPGRVAYGLSQYNYDESSNTASPVIYLSALAYLNGFVKASGYEQWSFIDLFIHELGHLHHFLSTMYHFQGNTELVSAWDVWRYLVFRKEEYANSRLYLIKIEVLFKYLY